MKHVFLLFWCLHFSLVLNTQAAEKSLDTDIKKIILKNKLNPEHLGIEISQSSKNIVSLNAEKKMIPASVTKILTAYAILKKFPANYKFKTELYYHDNNLYIKGSGDPSFVSENMWYLVNELVRNRIQNVNDIIVDETLFDAVRFDDSRESVRVDRSYDAPVGAMSFNWNSVNIFVKPGQKNSAAFVTLDPENLYFKLINKTQTKDGKLQKDLIIDVNQQQKIITVSGDVALRSEEKPYYKNVANPALWTAENLKSFLLQRNISVTGKLRIGVLPVAATKVATSESKSINSILADMNKFSNNYVAEMLTKNLAVLAGEKPAQLLTGIKVIKQELKNVGIESEEIYIENPSGFSRENKFSAHGLNKVLRLIQTDFTIFPGFVESLPILGIDGTLKKRMKNTPIQGLVRAKTGYLDGVVTLAGYVADTQGEIYSFVFLYNGPQDKKNVHEAFDQILIRLLE